MFIVANFPNFCIILSFVCSNDLSAGQVASFANF